MKTQETGNRIFLKELTEDLITEEYLSWFNDPLVTEFLESKNLIKSEVIQYIRQGIETETHYMYAIIYKENNKHIGNLKIGPILKEHKVSDLVTLIGDRDYWKKGLATESIRLGNKLAFEKYDLRKLSGAIASKNIGSIKCYTKADWVIEGSLKEHLIYNGEYSDRVMVSCFNPKYFSSLP